MSALKKDIFVTMFCVAGIGIDDMFVIVQCINNLKREADSGKWSLAERLGHGLRHPGVSITVTSATDVVAFAVGAVTVSSVLCSVQRIQDFCVHTNCWSYHISTPFKCTKRKYLMSKAFCRNEPMKQS